MGIVKRIELFFNFVDIFYFVIKDYIMQWVFGLSLFIVLGLFEVLDFLLKKEFFKFFKLEKKIFECVVIVVEIMVEGVKFKLKNKDNGFKLKLGGN